MQDKKLVPAIRFYGISGYDAGGLHPLRRGRPVPACARGFEAECPASALAQAGD